MRPSPSVPSVVITTGTLPVREGDGVPRFVLDLGISIARHAAVTILAPHCEGARRLEEVDGVQIERFRYFLPTALQRLSRGGVLAVNLRASKLAALQIPILLVAQVFALWRLVKKTEAIAVNSHWLIPQGLSGALVCRLLGVRHVLHVHAGDVYLLRRIPLGGLVARFVVKRSDQVLADGSHVRDALDELLGYPSEAVLRPMGVWFDRFNRDPGTPDVSKSIVFVGRFVEKKGIPYLVRAMGDVRRRHPDARLTLIGAGPMEDEVRELVGRLGLHDAVEFTGPLPHSEVVEHLRRSAVACVPSIIDSRGETEGMPTVVLEAMAAGTRVVGTNVDGIPDVLEDRHNGWLCEPADAEDLARAINEALADDSGYQRANAVATSSQHDWSRVGDEYAAYLGIEP